MRRLRCRSVKEFPERGLGFAILGPETLHRIGDARQAKLLIVLGRAVLVFLLSVPLDLFTAVFNLGQSQSG